MNLLLDTCILIDYVGKREPFYSDAKRIVAAGYFGDANLWTPGPSFKDAFYVLQHYADSRSIQQAFIKVSDVILPTSLLAEDYVRAAHLEWPDYEDCLVALAAEQVRADYLITRDAKGFERSTVPVLSPAAWLAMMEEEHDLTFNIIEASEGHCEG